MAASSNSGKVNVLDMQNGHFKQWQDKSLKSKIVRIKPKLYLRDIGVAQFQKDDRK